MLKFLGTLLLGSETRLKSWSTIYHQYRIKMAGGLDHGQKSNRMDWATNPEQEITNGDHAKTNGWLCGGFGKSMDAYLNTEIQRSSLHTFKTAMGRCTQFWSTRTKHWTWKEIWMRQFQWSGTRKIKIWPVYNLLGSSSKFDGRWSTQQFEDQPVLIHGVVCKAYTPKSTAVSSSSFFTWQFWCQKPNFEDASTRSGPSNVTSKKLFFLCMFFLTIPNIWLGFKHLMP